MLDVLLTTSFSTAGFALTFHLCQASSSQLWITIMLNGLSYTYPMPLLIQLRPLAT